MQKIIEIDELAAYVQKNKAYIHNCRYFIIKIKIMPLNK